MVTALQKLNSETSKKIRKGDKFKGVVNFKQIVYSNPRQYLLENEIKI